MFDFKCLQTGLRSVRTLLVISMLFNIFMVVGLFILMGNQNQQYKEHLSYRQLRLANASKNEEFCARVYEQIDALSNQISKGGKK